MSGIVSLLASATEIVDALGLGDRLVGISHECDYPDTLLDRPRASSPRFDPEGLTSGEIDRIVRETMLEHGSVYAIDDALLAELDPDLIITQAVCEVCAVPTGGVEKAVAERRLDARIVSLDSHTIEEILASIAQVGEAAHAREAARAAIDGLRGRLDAVAAAVSGAPRPRVLAIEWLDPPFTPGHWVPEMIERAGGENLAGDAGRPSAQVEWSVLADLDPDVLVIMPCGYGLDAAEADADAAAGRLAEVAPRAIVEGRSWVVDASAYFNRSGPRFVTGVEILAGLFHPDRLSPPAGELARRWSPDGS
ncbi:MAG: cobalamin-binding protein [Gemmatimonadota bacterium]|nr:cobalamin-binding protein [Gemmatimonadota bacterium]